MQKIKAYFIDSRGVFAHAADLDFHGPQPDGAVYDAPPEPIEGHVRAWQDNAWVQVPDAEALALPRRDTQTQFERDQARYQQRAAVKNDLIAYMAADNMGRVRSGAWTVPQLMSLMDDPAVASANAYMSTLSFELAAQAIATAATPLLTPEIRADWVGKLQANFYLEG